MMCEYNREIDEIQERFREMSDGDNAPDSKSDDNTCSFFSDAIQLFSAVLIYEVISECFPHGIEKYRRVYHRVNSILENYDPKRFAMLEVKRSCRHA